MRSIKYTILGVISQQNSTMNSAVLNIFVFADAFVYSNFSGGKPPDPNFLSYVHPILLLFRQYSNSQGKGLYLHQAVCLCVIFPSIFYKCNGVKTTGGSIIAIAERKRGWFEKADL